MVIGGKISNFQGVIEYKFHNNREEEKRENKSLNQGLSKHQEVRFTPVTKVKKGYCGFLEPPWCNKKIDPERYVSCGSYELLVSNGAQQKNEK